MEHWYSYNLFKKFHHKFVNHSTKLENNSLFFCIKTSSYGQLWNGQEKLNQIIRLTLGCSFGLWRDPQTSHCTTHAKPFRGLGEPERGRPAVPGGTPCWNGVKSSAGVAVCCYVMRQHLNLKKVR